MNLKNKTKDELIKMIKSLQFKIDELEEEVPSYEQLNERYDQGFDAGYEQWQRDSRNELSEIELKNYGDNILKLG